MRAVLCILAVVSAAGCSDMMAKDGEGRTLGDDLGGFHVVATLEETSCGPGALGSTELWEFDVRLARDGSTLYWQNGEEPVSGRVVGETAFSFDSRSVVEVAPRRGAAPGCSITRLDSATGKLAGSGSDVRSFDGSLAYGYVPAQDSDCTSMMGVEGGFEQLPCEIRYSMEGTRTEGP